VVPVIVLLVVLDIMMPGKYKKQNLNPNERTNLILHRDTAAEKCWDFLCCNCGHLKKVIALEASSPPHTQ
jgi:hypothetical protein